MSNNILAALVVLGIVYLTARWLSNRVKPDYCESCDGKGYWESTRGERNDCDLCQGTGVMPKEFRRKRK